MACCASSCCDRAFRQSATIGLAIPARGLALASLWLVGGAAIASAATLQVGPGRTYTVPSAAATVAGNGDTIEIDAGEYVGEWIFTDGFESGHHGAWSRTSP